MMLSRVRLVIAAVLLACSSLFFVQQLQDKQKKELATENKIPIVFHEKYDVAFWGIENLHPMDTKKFGKVFNYLVKNLGIEPQRFYKPEKLQEHELLKVHSQQYLEYLRSSHAIAEIAEVSLLQFIPNFLLRWKLLTPMLYATSGTILATQLAMEHGWALNLAGGFHHAKYDQGGGFCFYADIPLALHKIHEKNPDLDILVIDLDAHQGNGLASFFKDSENIYLFDMYNTKIYPQDIKEARETDFNVPVPFGIHDEEYLSTLKRELPKTIESVKPGLIVYNAGTDIFIQDPLGGMNITEQGILKRDEFVFMQALERKIPIVMLLSGGYGEKNAEVISRSLENLLNNHLNWDK